MTNEQKRTYFKKINELKEKISAKTPYPSREEILRVSNELVDLCYEILSKCNP